MSKAIGDHGEDKHEIDMPTIYPVLFDAIPVKQFVSLGILGYGTSIFKIAQMMVMPRTG